MDMAISLARRFNAHLSVIAPGIDRTDPGFYYAGAHAIALRENLDQAQEASHELKRAVTARMEGEVIAWDLDDRILQGLALTEYLSEKVRYSDLVVLPTPYGDKRSSEDVTALEAVLFGARVPVLVVPDGADTSGEIRRVQIAWNESEESMNAVRAALPFISEATLTDVAVVDPPRHAAGRSDPGGYLLRRHHRHPLPKCRH